MILAGTAKVDITPRDSVWMDGMIREHKSIGTHDPIQAKALYISAAKDRKDAYVIISVEVCALPAEVADPIRKAVSAAVDIPAEHIILAATHTHSGPACYGFFNPAEPEYIEWLTGRITAVVSDAADTAEEAVIGCASGIEDTVSEYRRLMAKDGHVVMNWEAHEPEDIEKVLGVPDPELGMMQIASAEDVSKNIAILFNHTGHPNVFSGDNYLISADYPGYANELLENEFGCNCLFVNGAQGSVDIDGLRDRDWEGIVRCGSALADAVKAAAENVQMSSNVSVCGLNMKYVIPARRISESELAWAEEVLRQTDGGMEALPDGLGDDAKALLFKELYEIQDKDVEMEQVCMAVGDTAFVTFPGELFTEIGMRIKSKSPFANTCIIGLANGYIGYAPTRDAIAQGGYEPTVRRVDDCAEDIILNNTIDLLNKVHRKMEEMNNG